VYCLPDVSIIHHIGRSIRQRGREFFAVNVYSLDRYYRLRHGSMVVRLLHLFGLAGFVLRLLAYEALYLTRHRGAYAELRDKYAMCAVASGRHLLGRPAQQESALHVRGAE
jgi:hypothetical protein